LEHQLCIDDNTKQRISPKQKKTTHVLNNNLQRIAKRKILARVKRPSKRLKMLVWGKKFTFDVGRAKCPCCLENDITQFDFECAHIKAYSKGGKTILSNLSPCCRPCNASCGQKGLWSFKKSLQYQ
jgi:hypothetical protein